MKTTSSLPPAADSFAGWLERFLQYLRAERRAAPRTLETRAQDLRQFGEFLHRLQAGIVVSRATVRQYLSSLSAAGLAPATINRKLVSVRLLFGFLVREGVLPHNPTANLVSLKKPRRLPRILSAATLLQALRLPNLTTPQGVRDRAILERLYGTGLRLQELVDLNITSL
ncbi:MAG: site-specific integrase, partial [candidate division KSB1 bacterium]|nr:site-specific integrase [candidate division KSB1 bacterium]